MNQTLALEALTHWNLPNASISFVAQRENEIYRVQSNDSNQAWALRLHRPGLRTPAELISESLWLQKLSTSGMGVPMSVPTATGEWCISLANHWIDMQTWLPGVTMEHTTQANHYTALGRSIAKLHTISDNWVLPSNFKRLNWDRNGLLGDEPEWGRFWENNALNEQQKSSLNQFRHAALQALSEKQHGLDFGLIHADLVSENVLIDDKYIQLIDFDDSGFGFRLFDIATVILRLQRTDGWKTKANALIVGYRQERALDLEQLNLFLALRACTYVGWIIPRRKEANANERCQRFINTACKQIDHWLKGGQQV